MIVVATVDEYVPKPIEHVAEILSQLKKILLILWRVKIMKKIALLLAIIFSLSIIPTIVGAVDIPLRVVVNGSKITFPDAQPFIDSNSRTQIPVSFIVKELGASVTWSAKEKKAVFSKGSNKMTIYIGKKEYDLNGKKMQMDTAAILKDNRTFVPVKYVAEAFNATVTWEGDIKTVYVDIKKPTSGERNIAGFKVAQETGWLGVYDVPEDDRIDMAIVISTTVAEDIPKQIDDMASILSQKCDKSTVDAVIAHIKPKTAPSVHLDEKFIYDNKTQRYIWIKESRSFSISINYISSETSKKYKEEGI